MICKPDFSWSFFETQKHNDCIVYSSLLIDDMLYENFNRRTIMESIDKDDNETLELFYSFWKENKTKL